MPSNESRAKAIGQLIAAGRLAAARIECDAFTHAAPSDAQAWRLAADVALRMRSSADAVQFMRRAVELAPGDAALLIQLGQYLLSMGRRADALSVALEVERAFVERPHVLDALGTLLTHCGEPGRALACFERAVAADSFQIALRYNLAMAQRMTGALSAAESNLDIVLQARPLDGEAHNARSGLRKQTRQRNHIAELETALRLSKGQPSAVGVEFSLAKELEDLGEYSRSFSHLSAACRRFRASIQYDVAGDVDVLDALRREHSTARLPRLSSSVDSDRPVFILGLPRSGTTLVERILGSHPLVYAAGELDTFPSVVIEAVHERCGGAVKKLEFVERTLELDFDKLGTSYIEATRPRTGNGPRFTDKLPLNYLYAGLIHAALPRARFVALRRNPMDVCYAMYKTLFASAYPFTYDLDDLARYYVAWDKLMRHWEHAIGESWLTLNYEDLVSDQETYSRRLVSHCGLEWDNNCLQFQNNPQPVATASAVQVRSPLYADSMGRWRSYVRELRPLQSLLERNGIACG